MIRSDALSAVSVTWVLVTVTAALIPHFMRLPLWLSGVLLLLLGWRYSATCHGWRLPGRSVRVLLVVGLIGGVVATYGLDDSSVDIFAALLASGTVLRFLEVYSARAARNLMTLLLVVLASGFIYGQSIPMALHAVVVMMLVLMTWQQLLLNPEKGHGLVEPVQEALRLAIMASPLMLLLFLTVPRLGPLWSMPSRDTAATSGVDEELAPGGITDLGLSDELAFRVGFDGDSPEPRGLYWRGLALDQFKEGRWRRSRGSLVPTSAVDLGPGQAEEEENASAYELIMEPTGQRWIYSLSPLSARDSDIGMDGNLALYAERSIVQRERFRLAGLPPPDSLPGLADGSDRRRALRLPDSGEPRARELARQWRRDADDDRDVLEQAMAWLRSHPFEYTLQPPAYGGDDALDSFLFDGRRGFCGHYASAFTYLMRAAGVPARVVVGYQGGERNPYENYVMVYQYNAHAWVEVWLEESGWVRVDPTTAVAPERIDLGAQAWLQQYSEQTGVETPGNGSAWYYGMRMQLDRLEYAWNRWVINFDTETQFNLLESLTGQRSERLLRLLLIGGLMTMVMISVALVIWSVHGKRYVFHGTDRVLGGFHRLLEVARRRGVGISSATGPWEASMAMSQAWPRWSCEILWVGDRVIDCCYAQREAASGSNRLRARLRLRWTLYLLRWKLWFSRPQTCS